MSADDHKQTFFRQGSWMVVTTFLSGLFMFAVHGFALLLTVKEYGAFGALLGVLNMMSIPSIALQTIFAQQTAAAISPEQKEQLTFVTQKLLTWALYLWLATALIILFFQKNVLAALKISNPVVLWVTVVVGLLTLCGPILMGVLQGLQNFFWLGWVAILNGIGRFVAVGLFVGLLMGGLIGAVCGVAVGVFAAFVVAGYHTRSVWLRHRSKAAVDWKSWLGNTVPLTLGLGASQFIFSVDVIFVQTKIGGATGYYVGAGMIGRGLVMFTAPLIVVMFPKIVHSVSHGKKTNLLGYTTLATAGLCSLAAAASTAIAIILKRLAVNPDLAKPFLPTALFQKLLTHTEALSVLGQLIPWFVWCMLPLALANVLLNNLMARKNFKVVPYLLLVIAAYAVTLKFAGHSFIRVIQILGVYNVIFLSVVAVFTWGRKSEASPELSVATDLQKSSP